MDAKRLNLVAFLLLINIFTGIVVFHYGLEMNYVDAIYFVSTIVTTIGFGDFNLSSAPTPIKVYGIYLMISGASGYALGFTLIVDTVVKSRLLEISGKKSYKMNDHVILCGFGRLGPKILDHLLMLGERVIVVDVQGDSLGEFQSLRSRNIPCVVGDMRQGDTLEKAAVRTCKSIVLCTSDDLANLEGALTARELCPDVRVVLRMYDQALAKKIEKVFGFQAVFSTSVLAAPMFAQVAHDSELVDITPVQDTLFVTTELTIAIAGGLAGLQVSELSSKCALAVLVLNRGDRQTEFPAATEKLEAGDRITITINRKNLDRLRQMNQRKP
jgi:Trk K+ transport system NAD-binding subunit